MHRTFTMAWININIVPFNADLLNFPLDDGINISRSPTLYKYIQSDKSIPRINLGALVN